MMQQWLSNTEHQKLKVEQKILDLKIHAKRSFLPMTPLQPFKKAKTIAATPAAKATTAPRRITIRKGPRVLPSQSATLAARCRATNSFKPLKFELKHNAEDAMNLMRLPPLKRLRNTA